MDARRICRNVYIIILMLICNYCYQRITATIFRKYIDTTQTFDISLAHISWLILFVQIINYVDKSVSRGQYLTCFEMKTKVNKKIILEYKFFSHLQ